MRYSLPQIIVLLTICLACRTQLDPQPPITLDPEPPFSVVEASILELQEAMAQGRITSEGLVEAYLRRIAAYDQHGPALNTMIRLNSNAIVEARALDQERRMRGPRGPLHGIPIVLKDNYDTEDIPTTAGSISLAGAVAGRDGFVAGRLRAAGTVLLGKTNMNEFALGLTTLSSITGQTRNPYNPTRYPGGSSGGTAAAVAASMVAVGWGTDTCGSIRVPAAFNGLFGLRPTKGLTSIQGIIPLCHSQDVSAPLARTVTDLAIALDATVGLDPNDPASAMWRGQRVPQFVAALDSTALEGARIGVLREFFGARASDAEVSAMVQKALGRMQQAGATVVEISIPDVEKLALSASVIAYEFRDDLRHYLTGHSGAVVQSLGDILERGLYLAELGPIYDSLNASPDTTSSAYRHALAQRATLQRRLLEILAEHELQALAYPTVRQVAGRIGTSQHDPNCEASANSGFPAISIPVGISESGVPVGMELLGGPLTDARLVALAYAWEQLAQPRRAPLYTPALRLRAAPPPAKIEVSITADSMVALSSIEFDAPTGTLRFRTTVTGIPPEELLAISLHRVPDSLATGAVVAALTPPGQLEHEGELQLSMPDRIALHQGRLYLTVLTTRFPRGTLRKRLPIPGGPPVKLTPSPTH